MKPPLGERLSDRIAIGLLTSTFPPELVDRVVAEAGRTQQRSRLLPARVVVYYVLAMCLFFGQGYEEVARLLTEGLGWARSWRGSWQVPTTAAITRARVRLGPEPIKALFAAVCRPVATPATVGAFYREWRLVAVDGTTFDLPDTVSNVDFFGRPGSGRGNGSGAYPQARVAAMAECGTHAIFAATTGPLSTGETVLAQRLFGALGPGMLLLADRGFLSFDLWREAAATGADLLWRVKSVAVLPVIEQHSDGSYLSHIFAARDRRHTDPITVRVLEYTMPDRPGQATVYRLITTILDPAAAPALDLAPLYTQRLKPPSRSAAIAGKGVFASRDQSLRQARALRPRSLAHRRISGAPIFVVPSRCLICSRSAATPWKCRTVTRDSSPESRRCCAV